MEMPFSTGPVTSSPDSLVIVLETLMKLCAAMDVTPNELLLGTSQNRTDYLQNEVQQKLTLCTPAQRRLVNRFIDLLLEEAQQQQ